MSDGALQTGAAGRFLAWVGDADPATLGAKMLAFRRIFLLHLVAESWFLYALASTPWNFGIALVFTMCLALGWFEKWIGSASEIVLLVLSVQIVYTAPLVANHLLLEFVVVLFLCLYNRGRAGENLALLRSLRWLPVIILFLSGLKKLWYGYYFDGGFFGHMVSLDSRFEDFFRPLLSPEEHLRLVRLSWPGRPGSGPFSIASTPAVVLSNLTWILELSLPLGLLFRKLRPWAVIGCLITIVGIELAAREALLGLFFVNLLLLFTPRDLHRRLIPLFVVAYGFLLLAGYEVIPRWGLR